MWIWTEARFWVRSSNKMGAFSQVSRASPLSKSMHLARLSRKTKTTNRFRWLRATRTSKFNRIKSKERCTTLPQSGHSSLKCLGPSLVPAHRSSMIIWSTYRNKSRRNKAGLTKTATSRSRALRRVRVGGLWGMNSVRIRVKCRLRRGAWGKTTFSISMRHRLKTI